MDDSGRDVHIILEYIFKVVKELVTISTLQLQVVRVRDIFLSWVLLKQNLEKLRSSILQDCLKALLAISIEQESVYKINNDDVIGTYYKVLKY